MAYPAVGALVGAPDWGVVLAGKFHGDPVDRWLTMLSGGVMEARWLGCSFRRAVVPVGQA